MKIVAVKISLSEEDLIAMAKDVEKALERGMTESEARRIVEVIAECMDVEQVNVRVTVSKAIG